MYKCNKIFPHTLKYCVGVEPVVIERFKQRRSWSIQPGAYLPIEFPDIAEDRSVIVGMNLIKVVEFLRYFLGQISSAFFMSNEPETGPPRSIAIKIFNPMLER